MIGVALLFGYVGRAGRGARCAPLLFPCARRSGLLFLIRGDLETTEEIPHRSGKRHQHRRSRRNASING